LLRVTLAFRAAAVLWGPLGALPLQKHFHAAVMLQEPHPVQASLRVSLRMWQPVQVLLGE
jgi:hypothetical protein